MENRVLAERGWGLAEATRHLLDTADPAEAGQRDRQIDRAIRSFLAQPAGSVELNDALADQLIILARHFGVEEAYFLDPDVAESTAARRKRQAESGPEPVTPADQPGTVAADSRATGATPGEARRQRRWAGVAAASVAVLAAAAVGGAVGYRIGVGAGRSPSPIAMAGPAAHSGPASESPRQVAEKVLPSVVGFRVHAGNVTGTGCGVVLNPDGLLLTNDHVIAAAARPGQITVQLPNGTSRAAHVVGRNPASDIAVVAADNLTGLTPIQAGNSDSVHVGQDVIAIGSPLDPRDAATSRVVSALNRTVVGAQDAPKAPGALSAIQTDARINPGDSGAPLVDSHGLVIGIETAAPGIGGAAAPGGPSKLGFAIPINQALRIAEQLIDTSRATQTILGMGVGTGDRIAALHELPGARIVAVAPGSPASGAGLKVGDIVVKVNGRPMTSGDELVAATRTLVPDDVVTVQLGDGRSTHIVLARRPMAATR
jgi:putative serine protease PepD